MEIRDILKTVDHTNLSVSATWDDIKTLCDDGVKYGVASVCIGQYFVKRASDYLEGHLPVCTVIGFPNGYETVSSKCFQAQDAIKNGADEIDTVINICALKEKNYEYVLNELRQIKSVCGEKILKVIIETCLLTEEEKIRMCDIVSESGADFIKTSTGFSSGGATREDVALFRAHVAPHVKIKAAGGIRTLDDATDFITLGASRLGTSRIVKIVKESEKNN